MVSIMRQNGNAPDIMERTIPEDIKDRLKAWQFYFKLCYFLYYSLGTVSIILSLTIIYLAFAITSAKVIAGLSFSASVCNALNYFLLPYKRAKGYVSAWRILSGAIIKYKVDTSVDVKQLSKAIKEGEKIIADHFE